MLSLTLLSAWDLENVFQTVDQTLIKRSFHVPFSLIQSFLYFWYVLNYYLF